MDFHVDPLSIMLFMEEFLAILFGLTDLELLPFQEVDGDGPSLELCAVDLVDLIISLEECLSDLRLCPLAVMESSKPPSNATMDPILPISTKNAVIPSACLRKGERASKAARIEHRLRARSEDALSVAVADPSKAAINPFIPSSLTILSIDSNSLDTMHTLIEK